MSNHLIVQTTTGHWYIVSTLYNRSDTQIIYIERYTGHLVYNPFPYDGIFSSPKEAIKFIAQKHGANTKFRTVVNCDAIVGYQIICRTCNICVVTKSECELVLPPRHKVYRVKEMKWISISLGYPILQTKNEEKNLEKLKTFPLADLHYYCESYDLTRPYPSTYAPHDYDEEFVWNHHLTRPFHDIGLKEWTIVLLQGLAVGKVIKEGGKNIFIALLCKRGAWNPGTRYNSRGMNERLAPGNEYEVEQLCWVTEQDKTVKYSSVIWRRGTVPIHWRSELTNAVTDASIIISKEPFKNIELYYQRVIDKYGALPIVCLDLLRGKTVHQEEDRLSQHYGQSLLYVKTMMNIEVEQFRFDWHHQHKVEGLGKAAENLWTLMSDKLKQFGVTSGVLKAGSGTQILDHQVKQKQRGIIRVNCADSLDRTNLCCFFNGIHIVAEQLRSIGVNILGTDQASWGSIGLTLEKVNQVYPSLLLLKYAEMFIQCGDVCATLYTNTEAMHTKAMREYAQHLPSARSNAQLLVERRYQNIFNDQTRQTQYEMFLGIGWDQYFPSYVKHLVNGDVQFVSHAPTFIVNKVPSNFKELNFSEEQILLSKEFNHIWIGPENQTFITIDISLPYYCRVTEIALTVRHGDSWESTPAYMNVYVGEHFNDSIIAFQHLQIPKCRDQTKLLYTLPQHVSGSLTRNTLYDFSGNTARPCMRCVRLNFYGIPPGECMTIGQIQIFGILAHGEKTSLQFFKELQQMSTSQSLQQALIALEQREDEQNLVNEPEAKEDSEKFDVESDSTDTEVDDYIMDRNGEDENMPKDGEYSVIDSIDTPTETSEPIVTVLGESPNEETNNNGQDMKLTLTSFVNSILQNSTSQQNQLQDRDPKEIYKIFVQEIVEKNGSRIKFLDALELELVRLFIKLTPNDRDSVLVEMDQKIARFNPNLFIYPRDLRIKKVAHKKQKSSQCHLCKSSIKLRKFACHYCWHSFCKKCISKTKLPIREFVWKANQQVCLPCATLIKRQEAILEEVSSRLKILDEQPSRDLTFENIFRELYPAVSTKNRSFGTDEVETLVSEFPLASIMENVETDPHSAPIESILLPTDILPEKYWSSPEGVESVIIKIILPIHSILTRIVMVVDKQGYTHNDLPVLQLFSSDRLPDLTNQGVWNLWTEKDDSQEGTMQVIEPNQEIGYKFPSETKVRILQLKVSFAHSVSSDVRRSLHLGRILVYGQPRLWQTINSPFVSDIDGNTYMDILSRKSTLLRSHIKSDAKLSKTTHTLDLIKSASTPVAGFQITVKHGARYGILSQVKDIRVSVLRQNQKKELESQEIVGHFVIPKCQDGTSLVYDFKMKYEYVSVVRFQFLSTHSAPEMSIGSIVLFNSESK